MRLFTAGCTVKISLRPTRADGGPSHDRTASLQLNLAAAAPPAANLHRSPVTVTTIPFDFGELFTLSARPVIAAAMRRGLGFHFDYTSGPSRIAGDAQAFQRSLYRLLYGASQVIGEGALILGAEASPSSDPGRVDLHVDAALSGARVAEAEVAAILAQLDLVMEAPSPLAPNEATARGTCPVLGAALTYRCVPSAGTLFTLAMQCEGEVMQNLRAPRAHGASALVLHGDRSVHGLSRRLERLGWHVSLFQSTDAFADALADDESPHCLGIAVESPRLDAAELGRIHARVADRPAADVSLVLAVLAGSPAVGAPAPPGWAVHVAPLLPSELWDLTRRADPDEAGFEHESRPMPLSATRRPRVLVVDDDEVNRIIASGLLQMIGYDAVQASSGQEAVALCRECPPDAVLMDINMPGIDGYEATALLKQMQRAGGIPPFPIIAATAAGTAARSLAHGLDGHLTKPLLADDLRAQLQRTLTGLAVGL